MATVTYDLIKVYFLNFADFEYSEFVLFEIFNFSFVVFREIQF